MATDGSGAGQAIIIMVISDGVGTTDFTTTHGDGADGMTHGIMEEAGMATIIITTTVQAITDIPTTIVHTMQQEAEIMVTTESEETLAHRAVMIQADETLPHKRDIAVEAYHSIQQQRTESVL